MFTQTTVSAPQACLAAPSDWNWLVPVGVAPGWEEAVRGVGCGDGFVGAAGVVPCLSNGLAWGALVAWAIAAAEPMSRDATASAAVNVRMSFSVARCGSSARMPAIIDRQPRSNKPLQAAQAGLRLEEQRACFEHGSDPMQRDLNRY